MARSDDWYIALNPEKTDLKEVPADLRGLDRLEHGSFTELGSKIAALIEPRYPKRNEESIDKYLESKRKGLLVQLRKGLGLTIGEVADLLGVENNVAKLVVQPMVGRTVRTSGVKKGTRYFPMRRGPIPRRRGRSA